MQADLQQFLNEHLPKVGWGTIIASCFTFMGCVIRYAWTGGKTETRLTEAREDLTTIKEDVRATKEDLRTLRPVLEDLTKAVNNVSLVLANLQGQMQARPTYRQ